MSAKKPHDQKPAKGKLLTQSEAIEPHEITANMNSDQISKFADRLIELMKKAIWSYTRKIGCDSDNAGF